MKKININTIFDKNKQTTDPSCMVKDIFFLHVFERKMLHHRGSRNMLKINKNESNTAITLIALIITIIILLILAGITLNMVIGENGIFGKANNAKNKTEIAQYEEELRMCVLELQADEATNGTTFGMDTIKNKFVEKVKELENTDDIEITSVEESETIEGIYKEYEFTIDEKYVAHIGEKSTGIRILTNIEPTGWNKGPVKVTITIKSNNGLAKIKPENEKEIDVGGKTEYVITKENIKQNTTFKYDVTDTKGATVNKIVKITTIDTNAPTKCEIEKTENTEEGLKITVNAEDAESGIEKIEYYISKKGENNYQKYETNPIDIQSGTYNMYAIAYDKAGNTKKSNIINNVKVTRIFSNVNAATIKNNPEKYYGTAVKGFTSANGQTDWKVFYVKDYGDENPDNDEIFLIAGDYIETSKVDIEKTKMTPAEGTKYRICWEKAKLDEMSTPQTMSHNDLFNIENRFNVSASTNYNAKAVSTLLNTDSWTNFLDKTDGTGKAKYAIGGPTVEMWMASWNDKYPEENDKYKNFQLLCNYTDSYGYYIGYGKSSGLATNTYLYESSMQNTDGYKYSTLYYPKTHPHDGNGSVIVYYMSSTLRKKC